MCSLPLSSISGSQLDLLSTNIVEPEEHGSNILGTEGTGINSTSTKCSVHRE